jgi:dTMP kinase
MKIYKNFISFEGIDFSGKTTQIELLIERLKKHDIEPILVREPGGTIISEKIRDILLSTVHQEMHSKPEILLYEAARAQLVHQKILPDLEKGKFVIADRYYDSTTAYQGFGRQLDLATVETINSFATSALIPYHTFFIDIEPELAESRQAQGKMNKDRLETGGQDFFRRIRKGFLYICEHEPERFIRVDGDRDPQEIARDIWKTIEFIWFGREYKY